MAWIEVEIDIEDAVKQGYYSANFSTAEPYPLWSSGNPDADDVD